GAGAATTTASGGTAFGGISPMVMIVGYCVVIFGVMYFFSIKPQKKKQAAMEEMRKSITVGDSVLLANGMYGKIVDVTAECYIVEFGTNKGIRIPVVKQEVYAKREPNLTNKEEVAPVEETSNKSLLGGLFKKNS
ncbi:MAG: preprotein translocase subunit YajC, partial [Anaerotignaceae bacterium]